MVVDAFTDLVFTPDSNQRHISLLGANEENDSTQPTDSNHLPTSPRDTGALPYLNSPQYVLASPNATLEHPILSPLLRSSPGSASCLMKSSLPSLTHLGDLPTPHGWGMISPRGLLTPSLSLDAPQFSSQDQRKDKLHLESIDHPTETQLGLKENDHGKVPSVVKGRTVLMREPKDFGEKDTVQKGPHFSFGCDENGVGLQEKTPDVRRRLFEEGTYETTLAGTNSEKQIRQIANPNLVKLHRTETKGCGLKSRIAPPPPIAIPTNPLSKHRIQEMPRKQNLATMKDAHPSKGFSGASRTSFCHLERRDRVQVERPSNNPQRAGQALNIPGKPSNVLSPGKTPIHAGVEEKRLVMTSEASSVLAELNRQRSQVEARREKSSSVSTQEPLRISGPNERTCCNCKASQCIKRYCPCFATSNFCGPGCGCRNCENTLNNSSCVGIARKVLMERDPNAFVPRIRSSQRQKARGRQTIKGCNCRKGCEKNYCICKENGLACGVRCTCSGPNGCQNRDQSKLRDIQQVIENMPKSEHTVPRAGSTTKADLHAAAMSSKTEEYYQEGVRLKTENLASHASPAYAADLPMNSAKPVLAGNTGYPALPTPTTPSMPYNPFFGEFCSGKKRSMTFGELSDGFKRIKVADPNDMPLPELKQSSSKHDNPQHTRFGLPTTTDATRLTGIPMTSKLHPNETAPLAGREPMAPDSFTTPNFNGSYHFQVDESRLQHVPRILRYKFGSGKSSGSITYLR